MRQAGIQVVICTGRPFVGVKKILQELALTTINDYVISFNGALTQVSGTKQVRHERRLSYIDFLEIQQLSDFLQLPYHIQSPRGIFTTNQRISKYTQFDSQLNDSPIYQKTIKDLKEIPIFKMIFCDDPTRLDQQIQHVPAYYREKYTSGKSLAHFFEFLHKEASKGQALSHLCRQLRIDRSEVMAIGDNDNDISMFQYAGTSVAMGNATAAAQETAKFETKSNDENGVAAALLKYV